eukprot:COSAG01_NODE_17972_length_1110_cov_0.735905_2_plen_134_part_00
MRLVRLRSDGPGINDAVDVAAVFTFNEYGVEIFMDETRCVNCGAEHVSRGTRFLDECNEIVIVHLLRYRNMHAQRPSVTNQPVQFKKIATEIKLAGTEDFAPFMSAKARAQGSKYRLFGAINHHGASHRSEAF